MCRKTCEVVNMTTKNTLTIILLSVSFTPSVHAQEVFTKKWDKRFGGTGIDWFFSFAQTSDGGYILGGDSYSGIGGDKTQSSQGDQDYWIVKIDSNGNKQWDKRFGGAGNETLHVLRHTPDNGYILGGISNSEISGDKTQPFWGGGDYWIVKVDSLGNKQWDKRFGGTDGENLWALQQTSDGGYIFGGYSNSGIGGDKTEENWDPTHFYDDGWLVKVDEFGNKQWDKRYGGTNQDGIFSIVIADDGGYVLGCYSASDSSGDKTQNRWGFGDFWILKIDSMGNKQWDKTYGGTGGEYTSYAINSMDGGYFIGGKSNSTLSGNISNPGSQWLLKIDGNGNKIWDRGYKGGIGVVNGVASTFDGGFLITCEIQGPSGPDKSEDNLGISQTWILKIDSSGNKQWDKTIFSPDGQLFGKAFQTFDGCYVIATSVTEAGGYVTEPNRGVSDSTNDYWIVKFCWEISDNISDLDKDADVIAYPNPFSTDIAITLQNPTVREASFTISNIQGQVLFRRQETNLASPYTKMLDLNYLPNGVYLIEVIANGERIVKKVVKE